MNVTPEEIAAFADGELEGERHAAVALAALTNSKVAQQIDRHRAFKAMLADHYAPVASERIPDRLDAMLVTTPDGEVVDLAAARQRHADSKPRNAARWGWIAGPALAASLVLAVIWPQQNGDNAGYAGTQLAALLDTALVADQSPASDTRILLSFRNEAGEYCRAFSGSAVAGIACRDDRGWKLEKLGKGEAGSGTDYRMAGSGDAALLAAAQDMADGPALDTEGEALAMQQDWLGQIN